MEKRVPCHMPDRPTSKLRQKLLEFGAVLNVTDDQTGRHHCSSTWRKDLNMVVAQLLHFCLFLFRNYFSFNSYSFLPLPLRIV